MHKYIIFAPNSEFESSEPKNKAFTDENKVNKHDAKKNIDCEKMAKSWNFSCPNLWLSSGGNKDNLMAIRLIIDDEISRKESISEASIDCDSVKSQP